MTLLSIYSRLGVTALLALAPTGARAQEPAPAPPAPIGPVVLLAGEDEAEAKGLAVTRGTVTRVGEGAAEGTGWVRLEATGEGREVARLTIPLPEGLPISRDGALRAAIRTLEVPKDGRCRWLAVDAQGRAGFQRPFDLPPVGEWTRLEWLLSRWRWGGGRAGDWTQIRALVLLVPAGATLGLDALGVERRAADAGNRDRRWAIDLAFGGRPFRYSAPDRGLVIVTDLLRASEAPDGGFPDLVERTSRISPWIDRMFGDGAPAHGTAGDGFFDRPLLLILERPDAFPALFEKLGEAWNVKISPPKAGGYTVQDIAAAAWDPAQGFERPVYLHEAVHAIAARRLRLVPGHPGHDWLQEGLANYVQVCFHPGSLANEVYPREFARPVGEGRGLFVPLADLLPKSVSGRHYAQLASLVAWFLAEQPAELRAITAATADGASPAEAFMKAGTTLEGAQAAWHAWGAKTFTGEAYAAAPGRHPGFPELPAPSGVPAVPAGPR